MPRQGGANWILTRLHFRYDEQILGEDLVFRPAPAIRGGNGVPDTHGRLRETGAVEMPGNNSMFQGRYVQLHWWEGEISCRRPQRGMWGMRQPPQPAPGRMQNPDVTAAPAGVGSVVGPQTPPPAQGCGRCTTGHAGDPYGAAGIGLLWLMLVWRRPRRGRRR